MIENILHINRDTVLQIVQLKCSVPEEAREHQPRQMVHDLADLRLIRLILYIFGIDVLLAVQVGKDQLYDAVDLLFTYSVAHCSFDFLYTL